jgi:hypothetical protein
MRIAIEASPRSIHTACFDLMIGILRLILDGEIIRCQG